MRKGRNWSSWITEGRWMGRFYSLPHILQKLRVSPWNYEWQTKTAATNSHQKKKVASSHIMGLTVELLTPGHSDGWTFPLFKQRLSHIHRRKAHQGLLKRTIPTLTCELSGLKSSGRVYRELSLRASFVLLFFPRHLLLTMAGGKAGYTFLQQCVLFTQPNTAATPAFNRGLYLPR